MEGQFDFSITVHSVVCILSVLALATGQEVQPCVDYLMCVAAKGAIVVEEQQGDYSRWSLYNNTEQHIAAVEFDPSEQIFYISDKKKKVISRYELIGWKEGLRFKDDIVTEGIENVTSLVVDPVNKRLYWTDSTLNTISTSRLDGFQRRDLFTADLEAPSNILLGPDYRYIYWTCGGTNFSTIQRAPVNGTFREKAEDESNQGPFVLAIGVIDIVELHTNIPSATNSFFKKPAEEMILQLYSDKETLEGQILYRIMTLTGTLRQYDLRRTFLSRASDRDLKHMSFLNTSSVIIVDGTLCWSSNTKVYYSVLPEGDVYELPGLPCTSQLLYYTAKSRLSASNCMTFDEEIIITTDRSTKASSPTLTPEQSKTSLSAFITHSPKSTVVSITTTDRNTNPSSSTQKPEQLKPSLPTYITQPPKSTVVSITTTDRSTKTSSSAQKPEQLKTSLSTYITHSSKSAVVTTLFSHKNAKNVFSIPTSHPAKLQLWHTLLSLVIAIIVVSLLVIVIYKRRMSRSFHLPYPDKFTFKLLEKQSPSFSTTAEEIPSTLLQGNLDIVVRYIKQ